MIIRSENWRTFLNQRIADAQFQAILKQSEQQIRPRLGAAEGIAMLFALLILMTPLAVAGLGLFLLIWSNASVVGVIFGAALMVVGYFLFPTASRTEDPVLERNQAPALFDLVDGIADRMGAPRVDGVVIEPGYNAWMGAIGRQRRRILGLGLALWQVLDAQQRVALISHELAHQINKDPGRSFLIGSAEETLARWHDILSPDENEEERYEGTSFVVLIAILLMRFGAFLVRQVQYLLFLLHMRISQRAEYYADLLGARNAGTDAMQGLLQLLVCRPAIRSMVVRGWSTNKGSGQDLMQSLKSRLAGPYSEQIGQLWNEMTEERSSIDFTHPPTIYRFRFLEAQNRLAAEFDTETVDWTGIEAEIQPLFEPMGKFLMDNPDLL